MFPLKVWLNKSCCYEAFFLWQQEFYEYGYISRVQNTAKCCEVPSVSGGSKYVCLFCIIIELADIINEHGMSVLFLVGLMSKCIHKTNIVF